MRYLSLNSVIGLSLVLNSIFGATQVFAGPTPPRNSQEQPAASSPTVPSSEPPSLGEEGATETGAPETGAPEIGIPETGAKNSLDPVRSSTPGSSSSDPGATEASRTVYECMKSRGRLFTVAHTSRGMIPLIEWRSLVFGQQWTPEVRCNTVSNRFQQFSAQNLLQFISTGALNNYPIICVSKEYGDCLNDGLLLTLEPKDDPNQVLRSLFDLSSHITRSGSKTVIDMEYLLDEKAPLEATEGDLAPAGSVKAPADPAGPPSADPNSNRWPL
ncbi:COP23 domain-containing protein [Lyngbya confervoides]|uniref:COP23 domain-containing protein n=1 Tax=Lyngbya confervoides BDU141951 TaxID=1574623 RepID=A0ABD4T4C6_9CYAN|nr:COP23 domain-containing protein [Lyngbya confervoides]MCM1983295.1 COP23 domain-containing protein [Lyngbya confervoides BDU141951]